MKQLLYIPVNGYFFRGKTNATTLKRCLNQCGRHFSALTTAQDTRREMLIKSMLVSKKQENIYIGKRFSSSLPKGLILMDFDVWLHPKLLPTFRKFSRSTVTALQVVTTLLSELRFSELEGLLTEKCKQEVERNLKCWPRDQVSILAVKPDKVIKISPCDVTVFSDEKNEKVFVEIRVIHYVWIKYSSKFEKTGFENTLLARKLSETFRHEDVGNLYMCGVFNSKFIKEFTEGVTDQWTINAINLKCYSDFLTAF